MHIHAWDSPPLFPLTQNDSRYHPYLIEFPGEVIEAKIDYMTNLLEDIFQTEMLSHRAGRWAFDCTYARVLIRHGFKVDCSVTPHVSWTSVPGDPRAEGGSDYSRFREDPYYLDLADIRSPGSSTLLEVPMTIRSREQDILRRAKSLLPRSSRLRRKANYLFPDIIWLRPNGRNLQSMLSLVRRAVKENRVHLEFMLHSSELMPGGSPTFGSRSAVDALYLDLDALFSMASRHCRCATLQEFESWYSSRA